MIYKTFLFQGEETEKLACPWTDYVAVILKVFFAIISQYMCIVYTLKLQNKQSSESNISMFIIYIVSNNLKKHCLYLSSHYFFLISKLLLRFAIQKMH